MVGPDTGLINPFGMAFDDNGAMLIAEYEGGRLWKHEVGKPLQQFGTDIPFNGMHNLVRTKDGRIYISDTRANYVRMIDERTGEDTIVAERREAVGDDMATVLFTLGEVSTDVFLRNLFF